VQANKLFLCRNDVQAIAFLRKGSYAVKEIEVVINQLTSERNDQTVWDPIVI
jgi:hypothetical protein